MKRIIYILLFIACIQAHGQVLIGEDGKILVKTSTAAINELDPVFTASNAPRDSVRIYDSISRISDVLGSVDSIRTVGDTTFFYEAGTIVMAGVRNANKNQFDDNLFRVYSNFDDTRKVKFDLSQVSTSSTRVLTVPDKNGTIATTDDVLGDLSTDTIIKYSYNTSVDSGFISSTATENQILVADADGNAVGSDSIKVTGVYFDITKSLRFNNGVGLPQIEIQTTNFDILHSGSQSYRLRTDYMQGFQSGIAKWRLSHTNSGGLTAPTFMPSASNQNVGISGDDENDTLSIQVGNIRYYFTPDSAYNNNTGVRLDGATGSGSGLTAAQAIDTVEAHAFQSLEADTFNVQNLLTDTIILGGDTLTSLGNDCFIIALSDSTTELTTANGDSWDWPYNATIDSVQIGVNTAPTGSSLSVDIKQNGSSIFSTLVTIDATETTSVTAATDYVLSTTALNWNDRMQAIASSVGATFGGTGLKVYIYYKKD